jgi:prepilin-type N-terminal cleavage/methylation domain-containing protein/prepilin-type processing-associated H-X9-DG protein
MTRPERSAFTLVELLVVVVIIAMLMALLLPAINRSRQEARRAECLNNEKQIFTGIANYEQAKGHLPGYVNKFGEVRPLSWAVVIFPYVDQNDYWELWRDPDPTNPMSDKYQNSLADLPIFKCRSDTHREPAPLSYVVNCGIADAAVGSSGQPVDGPSFGLFHNRMGANPPVSTTDRIKDGAANTLLLSENVQATRWAPELVDPAPATGDEWVGTPPSMPNDFREAHVGMVWWPSNYGALGVPGDWVACRLVNQCLGDEPGSIHIKYARPSSFHGTGVNATFADGSQRFLNTVDLDYNVFLQQMIPDDAKASGMFW